MGVAPVGCAVMAYDYFTCDMVQVPHGRAPARLPASSAMSGQSDLYLSGRRRFGGHWKRRNSSRGDPR